MSGFWQQVGTTTITVNAPAGAAAGGQVTRVRSIAAVSTAAGNLVISDSVLGTVFQMILAGASGATIMPTPIDVRGSPGGNLTISWSAAGASISVEGDFVPIGYPYGQA